MIVSSPAIFRAERRVAWRARVAELWGAALHGDPCRECGWDWPGPADSIGFVAGVPDEFAGVPDEFARVLAGVDGCTRYPDHGWTVTGYVAHVADHLRHHAEHLAGALAAGAPAVGGYDPDAFHHLRDVRRAVEFVRWPYPGRWPPDRSHCG
ncbi:hypothetical protein [Kineococcus sp. SYSU DK003]|uniref:hypothetical protein n=1 Tax=Kineococcus sp. SYSU DK003 TaxID=3383124 RepID=UPI003D7DA778